MRPSGRVWGHQGPHPDEREVRGRRCSGRYLRPGRVRGVPSGLPDVRLERALGFAAGRPRDHGSVGSVAIAGLWLLGLRFGGPRLGATLAFAWAAWPFTLYSASSNTNDLIEPALLVWGFYFATSPFKRGAVSALAAWTKFSALIVLPLWSGYPDARALRPRMRYIWGFVATTAVVFVILLFDPSPEHAVRAFYHDTFGYQFGRSSPFSLWDWRQYHAKGLPDLRWVQRALYALLIGGAVALGWWPRRRSPLRLAAYTGALLVGFEMVLTHWSWLYLPWFFPFVAFALLAPQADLRASPLKRPWRVQARLAPQELLAPPAGVDGARGRDGRFRGRLGAPGPRFLRQSEDLRHLDLPELRPADPPRTGAIP